MASQPTTTMQITNTNPKRIERRTESGRLIVVFLEEAA